tara:strand:+ start:2492 stop:3460 length:969 start_codon:yes stop_codon:yes gene_type:complete
MRICVTGGNGMVGSCIKDIKSNYPEHEFVFLDRKLGNHSVELTSKKDVLFYFSKEKFDAIIHLAADVGGLYKNMDKNVEMFNNNISINQNVLEAANKYGIQRGIFCLSSCIYPPKPSKFPMDETMIHEGPPHPSNEGYAYAKRMLEVQCRNYNKAYGREYICVVPVNLYGPHDNFSLTDGHLIPMVIHRFYKNLQWRHNNPGGEFIAYGTGNPLRQFLFAPDFAKIICEVLVGEKYKNTEPLICCNNDELTIKEIIETIADTMTISREEITWDTTKSNGCMKKTVSNEKFKSIYPDFKFTNLKDGLKYTYKWFRTNYDSIRQ